MVSRSAESCRADNHCLALNQYELAPLWPVESNMQKILLVDDDDDVREMFAEVLREAGYSVEEAENGECALESLERLREPCLVLLDVMMPRMDGPALLDALRRTKSPDAFSVIAMSAGDTVHQVPHASRFLAKPILPEHLLRVVGEFCEPADPRSWIS